MNKVSRLLSVDASVLRGAGAKPGHSAHCANVLNSILEICHRAVLSRESQEEWNKHQSRIGGKWRASMIARKKLIRVDISAACQLIMVRIDALESVTQIHRAALIKDVHVLAAAVQGDRFIVTCDKALSALCNSYSVASVEWLVLSRDDDAVFRDKLLSRLAEMSKVGFKSK